MLTLNLPSKGTQIFTPIQDSFSDTFKGQQAVFLIGAAFATMGGLIAWFLIPDKEKDLESEDKRFREFLEANGYDTGPRGESIVSQVKRSGFKLDG
jgi:hypothetical protein